MWIYAAHFVPFQKFLTCNLSPAALQIGLFSEALASKAPLSKFPSSKINIHSVNLGAAPSSFRTLMAAISAFMRLFVAAEASRNRRMRTNGPAWDETLRLLGLYIAEGAFAG